jgi:hypothetical protein
MYNEVSGQHTNAITPNYGIPSGQDVYINELTSVGSFSRKPEQEGVYNRISCCEYFLVRMDWMVLPKDYGDILCPKSNCKARLGVYNNHPEKGIMCTCGKMITPGYLVYKSKLKKGFAQAPTAK